MFFDISLIPLAVLIIVGQLKKAPPRLLNNPSYQKEREQVLKHRRILDTLGVGFALALMIIQWGNPALSLAFQAFVIWLIPSQLYDLWQKFNVPRGVLFACAIARISKMFCVMFAFLESEGVGWGGGGRPPPPPPPTTILFLR